jgi:ABC-type taurine transport system substrate-binding protein
LCDGELASLLVDFMSWLASVLNNDSKLIDLTWKGLHPVTFKEALSAVWFGSGLVTSLQHHAAFLSGQSIISKVDQNYGNSVNQTYRASS